MIWCENLEHIITGSYAERITDGTHIYVQKIILEQSRLGGIQVKRTRGQQRRTLLRKPTDPPLRELVLRKLNSLFISRLSVPKENFPQQTAASGKNQRDLQK